MERGTRMEKEKIIKRYFQSWIDRDIDVLEQVWASAQRIPLIKRFCKVVRERSEA